MMNNLEAIKSARKRYYERNLEKIREYARNHTTQVIIKKKLKYVMKRIKRKSDNMYEIAIKIFQEMKSREKTKI